MAQDIRELLKQDSKLPLEPLRAGHEKRFLERLDNNLPKKSKRTYYTWINVAASIAILLSVSIFVYQPFQSDKDTNEIVSLDDQITKNATVVLSKEASPLAKISPEYEKVENYLLTSIKFELSQIEKNDTNKELIESFMMRLSNLDAEYQRLNDELVTVGNMQSVEAMIENLTLRLDLLKRLKDKLKELETIDDDGQYNEIHA
ncbi:hypothetical protein ACJRPK_10055 [Aquimarina sp. 2-A2]|uniref:hypothetical protein n=1 Tax=Aquimarina sp. 2-A2 TaxID=3382644 RepID=UPI00387F238F